MIGDRLLLPHEAADRLQITVKTLRNWRSLGIGPIWTKVGVLVRYSVVDIETWQSAQRRGTTKEVASNGG